MLNDLLFNFISQHITLSNEEKEAITSMDVFRSAKKGEVLLSEGAYSAYGYFVLQGCIRTYYVIDGEEKTTAFYTEMEGVTPHCVLDHEKSEYYVACVEDTIYSISSPDMEEEMFQKFPNFEKMCRVLSEKLLVKQQIDFDDFKTSSPEQRYHSLLEKRPDLLQRVPQHQIASYLGIKPQSLSRIRARIAEKKRP